MAAPIYDWACQKCGKTNRAHTAACVDCGGDAHFKAGDLPRPVRVPVVEAEQESEPRRVKLWVLFPEAFLVLPLALYTPYWALRSFSQGQVLAPLAALLVEVACLFGFVEAMKAGYSWLALGSMLIFLWICFEIGVYA